MTLLCTKQMGNNYLRHIDIDIDIDIDNTVSYDSYDDYPRTYFIDSY